MSTTLAALRQELAEQRALISQLLNRVERLERAAPSDAEWLQIVARAVGEHVFSAGDLVRHVAVDPSLRGLSVRQIGARLKRIARHPVPGYVLTVVDRDESGCIWQISQVDPCGRTADDVS